MHFCSHLRFRNLIPEEDDDLRDRIPTAGEIEDEAIVERQYDQWMIDDGGARCDSLPFGVAPSPLTDSLQTPCLSVKPR